MVKDKVVVIGPQPPAIGGIASIVYLLNKHLSGVDFIDSSKPTKLCARLVHPLVLLMRILRYCSRNRRCKVLFFSSAYRSFWEKSCWTFFIGRLCGAKIYIVMVDGNFPEFFAGLSERKQALARYFMADSTVVAQSPSWKLFFQKTFPNSKIDVITGGIDTDFFAPEHKTVFTPKIKILYVGWIIKEKGVYDLLAACSLLKDKLFDLQVELVGPIYCDRNELDQLINSYQLQDMVAVVGPIHSREALRSKYCSSDVFLFPSHYEGFPMALLEALSCGLPAIGSNVGGIPDILDHGHCGLIVERRNPQQIASALERFLSDEQFRLELRTKSRERALKEFSISASADSYRNLLGLTKD